MNCFMTGAISTVGQCALCSFLEDKTVERIFVLVRHPETLPIEDEKLTIVPGGLQRHG